MKSDVVPGVTNASWPVLVADDSGVIRRANPAALQAFGDSLVNGTTGLASLWAAENEGDFAQFLARCEAAPGTPIQVRVRGANGSVVPCLAAVCLIEEEGKKFYLTQLLAEKPSESKNASLEANLAQKQKLDCALQLARTVSLDFNNALTSILGHTSLVLSKMEPGNPWRHSLMEVEKSAAKAAEIANDLGAFSRQEKEARVQLPGNLNQLLQRNVEMFQSAKLEKEVTWSLQFERKLRAAKFDEAKMQQAFVKLMENAIEALGASGRIVLSTKNIDLTEPTQDRNAQLAAGSYVCAEITDTGSGIETDVLPRIFEPFFTTKRSNKHRGLGLAWVYGIVTNHGGAVAVSSQPGMGTSVRIYLPADKKLVNDSVGAGSDLNGTETILMVDDEDLLLTMGHAILSSYGYNVLTANSGQKALEIIAEPGRQVDLLLTDLVMPNMSGRELVEQVRRVSPYTRILCSSGYVRPSMEEQQNSAYLQKPFTSQELLMKVKHALSSTEPANVD
jgi:two-component system cell cycle sensor histidine kinase/response regulator CckA